MGHGTRTRGRAALWAALAMLGGMLTPPVGPAQAADKPEAAAYAPGRLLQVHLTIPADEYAAMQPRAAARGFGLFGAPKPPEKPADPSREVHTNTFGTDLPWARGTVRLGEQTFADVALRYKGNGTIFDAGRSAKKSFKIDLDRRGGTGTFWGSKTVNLHSGVADPSKYREAFGYGLYRAAGVPASRTAFAEVHLTVPGKFDNELLGLYIVVEEVDKAFLRAHYGTDKGLLMKPEGVRDPEDKGDNWDSYKKQYRPKREATPEEAKRVVAFARLVHKGDDDAFAKEIGSYLDIDEFLRFLAATTFIANPDSFFMLGHNYYVYVHPKDGRFHVIPWDLDRAFSNLPVMGTNSQQMNLSLTKPYAGTHRLTERLLALPGMADRYRSLCKELAATVFARERLLKQLDEAEVFLKEPLARDAKAAQARREAGPGGSPLGFTFGKPPELRTFVQKRTASAAAQLAGTSQGHVPRSWTGPGAQPKVGDFLAGALLVPYDTDKDGLLSREEWLALPRQIFDACTKDAEGKVDQKALAAGLNALLPKVEGMPPPPPGFSGGDLMARPILTRADADKDGRLTRVELLAAAEALFDQFDKAKSGKLDEDAFSDLLSALFPLPNFALPAKPPASRPGEEKKP